MSVCRGCDVPAAAPGDAPLAPGWVWRCPQACRGRPNLSVAIPTSPCVCFPRRVFKKTSPNGKVRTYRTYRAAPGVGGGTQSGFSFPWKPPDFSLPVLVPPHWAHFGGLAIWGSWMAVTNPFPLATRSPSSPSTWGRGTSWTTWSPWTLWVSGVPACSKSRHFPTNI